jgi:hypothetical protein
MLQKSLAHLRFFKLFGRLGCLSIPFLGFFAKDKKLYSYISAVFVTKDFQNQAITTAVVCGLDKHNFSKSALPLLENEQALCSKKGSWQLGERSTSWKYQLELLRSGFFGE